MKNPVFTGAGVAIITPMYEDGSINFDELGRIIEDQIARHTDAIIICGTTGESSTLTDAEHRRAGGEDVPAVALRAVRLFAVCPPQRRIAARGKSLCVSRRKSANTACSDYS